MAFRKHQKSTLLELIIQALYDDAWNVIFLHDPRFHPFILRIYKENIKIDVRIYVWNLTHGGGAARAPDEYRIQITGVEKFDPQENGVTLILGWWEQGGVFAGFDYSHHSGILGSSPSIQIREEALRNAFINGFSTWKKENDEIAIAIRPDMLGEYIKNLSALHSFGQSSNDLNVLDAAVGDTRIVNNAQLSSVTEERRSVITQVAKKIRDVGFKKRVLTAYGNACSFCGIQLRLIDAAHILPVEKNGTDETWNGIALCALHHRAYDRGLVTFDETYKIRLNEVAFKKLAKIRLVDGRHLFDSHLKDVIILPLAVNDRPHVDSIKEANIIRGWIS